MMPLKITFGGVFTGMVIAALVVYALYYYGKKNAKNTIPATPNPTRPNPIKPNPSTPQAKKAFISNIDKLMPFFSGVEEISVNNDGLTDAIIDINDQDLIALWYQFKDRKDLWLNQMAAFGVAPDACKEFVAVERHKERYTTVNGSEIQNGQKYIVLSSCWLFTTIENEKTVKKVIKKGIEEEKK